MSRNGKPSRCTAGRHAENARGDRARFLIVESVPCPRSNPGQALVIAARPMCVGVY
jgi:hypothetical protein